MRKRTVLIVIAVVAMAGVAQAADLYSTDFDALNLATINGQDSWVVGNGDGTSTDGMVADDGTGNQVLSVTASTGGWGDEVRRSYNADSTLQYLTVEMDFQMKDGPSFYFMDNNGAGGGGPESIDWDEDPDHQAWSNANPGIAPMAITYDTWYHIGIQVDQQSKEILFVNYDGTWLAEDDTPDGAMQMTRLVFRSYGYVADESKRLWIDNLSITDSDTAIPEPSVFVLAGLGLLALIRRRR
jgi:MYXO-CTERM domain-containing protein